MSDLWWYVSRSSGIVATVLIVLALTWGLFFAARATGNRRRPNWWLDLHKYLGGLAFVFTVVHVVAVYQDHLSGIGLLQIFVPMTATGWEWGITWGVLATYIFAAVVFTSWPRKRLSRRALAGRPPALGAGHPDGGDARVDGRLESGLAVVPDDARPDGRARRVTRPYCGSARRSTSVGGDGERPAAQPARSSTPVTEQPHRRDPVAV